ncbi:PD-(D/E)XK nuclease family protein [Thermoactinomyces sp. DSM 45892]|uniref:PD-(D/E)XK nuclease family protein n=1 Tax=Thermoactinomyces sp. DSM 45892 TaxID=1882753 RepID=UPI000895182B|nr:PD-(D/E)XK nuclease family protein [Thermoactinomyces sp. DSM 45892]SDY29957.1 ATP-dependent helicase/DNAse subunit B [Thermoactinomyces sp. DSM 45892]
MAGTIMLHPIERTGRLALFTKEHHKSKRISYVFPSSELVSRYRSEILTSSIQVMTMDQMVLRMSEHSREMKSPHFRYKCIESCMNEGIEEGWFTHWQELTVESFSWIMKVEKWIGEVKRAGVLPSRLRRLLPPENQLAQGLVSLYERYQQKMKQYNWLDQEEVYFTLLKRLKECDLTEEVFIFEQFNDLHYIQESLLSGLVSRNATVEFHLLYDRKRKGFRSIKATLQRLQNVGFQVIDYSTGMAYVLSMDTNEKTALQHLKKSLFVSDRTVKPFERSDDSVQIWQANHKVLEVRRAIRQVKEWMLRSHIPGDQIVLVTEQWDVYAPLVRRVATEAGVPFQLPRVQSGMELYIGQVIRSAFACRDGDITTIPFLSRFAGIELTSWDVFQQSWRKSHYTLDEILQCWLEATEPQYTKQVLELWRWIGQIPEANRELDWYSWFGSWVAARLRPNVTVFRDDESLQDWVEDRRLWMKMEQWCQEMSRGEMTTPSIWSFRDFAQEVTNWLSSIQLVIDPEESGGVRLLAANMICGQPFTSVILLGCEEKNWPGTYQDDWLFPDQLRRELGKESIWLLTSDHIRERQKLSFLMAVMSAQDQVVFSYSIRNDMGDLLNPSPFIREVIQCLPQYDDEWKSNQHMLSPHFWLRPKDILYAVAQESVYQPIEWLDRIGSELKEEIRIARSRSAQMLSPWFGLLDGKEESQLSRVLAAKVWSASELDVLMSCRFRYLAQRVWDVKLREKQGRGLSRMVAGNAIHAILHALFKKFQEQGEEWEAFSFSKADLEALFDEVLTYELQHYPSIVKEIEKRKEIRRLMQFIGLEEKGRKGGKEKHPLQPTFFELSFGLPIDSYEHVDSQSKREPVTIPLTQDMKIQVRGKIDRVDMDEGHLVVYDYKSGNYLPTLQELYEGKAIQLPLYLWVLQEGFGYLEEQIIGGAFYTSERRSLGLWKEGFAQQKANIHRSVKGLDTQRWSEVHHDMKRTLANQIQALRTGEVRVKPTWNCPSYCVAKRFCRYRDPK